jgi:hypothetical protein
MKRILMVLAVALVMAAMLVVSLPAFAGQCSHNPNCSNPGGQHHGASQTFKNPGK